MARACREERQDVQWLAGMCGDGRLADDSTGVEIVSEFYEYDPLTGIRTDTRWDENTQEMTLIRTADVESVLDFTKACANEAGVNKEGIAQGWWLYAKLPPIVILQMRAKGIDVFDNNNQKRLFQEINEHYPWLKTTTGKVESRSARKIYVPPDLSRKNSTDGSVAKNGTSSD